MYVVERCSLNRGFLSIWENTASISWADMKRGTGSSRYPNCSYVMGFSLFLGERFFPPPSGLSYSTWFCIEHFSTPPNNHPVRLLTVVRRANSSEQHYVCLAIVLSAKDRSLIVSTKEELLQNYGKSCATSSANADSIIGMQQPVYFKPSTQKNYVLKR